MKTHIAALGYFRNKYVLIWIVLLWLAGGALDLQAKEKDWFIYLGDKSAQKSPRKSMNAAEALPPLPLPATPLRRTERKKPPQPDYLIGKVIWGEAASFTSSNGQTMQIADWNLCPTDTERFIDNARATELAYHWMNINLDSFHYDPAQLPGLLFSGVRILRLSDAHVKSLRAYILNGGMIIFDSIAGSPYFYDSARKVASQIIPEGPIRQVPPDHPLYHIFFNIEKVNYPRNPGINHPIMEGVYVGSRIGIMISKYGLGCGWNKNLSSVETLKEATYYDIKSANMIGINLATYIVGYAEAGKLEGKPEVFGLADKQVPTDEFVFAQIKHQGAWNVHPGSAAALLMKLRRHTSVRVNLKRVGVDLDRDDLSPYPFLYLTGLDDFTFSPRAVAALRHYLSYDGVLLVNNGLGMATFDRAAKRELAKIIPEGAFQTLPEGHGLFNCLFPIGTVEYSPSLAVEKNTNAAIQAKRPYLQGMNIGGDLRVIYSPYDLEAGWLDTYYPMLRGYQPLSAQQIGMNIITYVMIN